MFLRGKSSSSATARVFLSMSFFAMVVACSATTAPQSGGDADRGGPCPATAADRWAEVRPVEHDWPTLRVPQPQGWEPAPEIVEAMNRAVRGPSGLPEPSGGSGEPPISSSHVVALADRSPAGREGQRILIASLVDEGNKSGETDPEEAFKAWHDVAASTATITNESKTKVCGWPALSYTSTRQLGQGRTGTGSGLIVVIDVGGHVWEAQVGVTTRNAADPAYQRDSKTMLDGLQIHVPDVG